MLQILLGQIPEAIFFSLFMIYTKRLKEKRILYISIMITEYLILAGIIQFNVWLQIIYTFMSYLILKILYNEKAQITDIFTFAIASIFMIITSAIMYGIAYFIYRNIIICVITQKIILFLFLIIFKNKLYKIQNMYKTIWNRNKNKSRIKTTTFRSLNVVIFNCMFYIINIGMLLAKILK